MCYDTRRLFIGNANPRSQYAAITINDTFFLRRLMCHDMRRLFIGTGKPSAQTQHTYIVVTHNILVISIVLVVSYNLVDRSIIV